MKNKRLLFIANQPSPNTKALVEAAIRGASHPEIENVEIKFIEPLQAGPEDIEQADGIILGTTENLSYMSGALKDFFDRSYNQVLESKQGLPVVAYIRAGSDGTGTKRALETIIIGLKWRWLIEPLVLKGDWKEEFLTEVEELAMTIAAQLDLGA